MLTSRFGASLRNSKWYQHVRFFQPPRTLPPDEPNFKDFNGFYDLAVKVNQVLQSYPNGLPDNADIVIYVHGGPGALLIGEYNINGRIQKDAVTSDENFDVFASIIQPLLTGKNSRLILTGCSILGEPNGDGTDLGNEFGNKLKNRLKRPVIGTIGSTGIGGPNFQIEPGGTVTAVPR